MPLLRRRFLIGSALVPIVQRPAFSFVPGGVGGCFGIFSPDGTQIDTLNSIGGTVTNGYGDWTFGPMITPPTAAGPPGPFGVYCYVKLNGINLNVNFNVPSASAIRVDYCGNVFFLTTQNDRWWFQFVGYNANAYFVGSPFIDPTSVVTSQRPPAGFTPGTPSPDGTTISRPSSGHLTTHEGTWKFAAARIALNDAPLDPPSDAATDLQVNANGRLFAKLVSDGNWHVYLNYQFFSIGATVPTLPFPTEVTLTPNFRSLSPSTPLGTVVTTASVTTSDGSDFFASGGTLQQAEAGFLSFTGADLKVISPPPASTIIFCYAQATLNGIRTAPGASVIEVSIP